MFERLAAADVSDNVSLSRAVGWNDSEGDWRVLLEAGFALGLRREGALIARGVLGTYDAVGTIAKMVVAPEVQRQKLGAALLDALIDEAERRGLSRLGLVATPFGRPLYESRGFTHVGDVVVFTGTPPFQAHDAGGEPARRVASASDLQRTIDLDGQRLGCNRAGMLRGRWRESTANAMVENGVAVSAYGLAAQNGEQRVLGPIVADSDAAAHRVLRSLCAGAVGPIRIDVPGEQGAFRQWLLSVGFRELGVRPEMARGSTRLPWQAPERYALATQAWG